MDLDPMSKKTMHDFYFNMGDAVKDFSKWGLKANRTKTYVSEVTV